MFGLLRKVPRNEDGDLLRRALGPEVAVLISASCCAPGTQAVDAQAEAALRAALASARLDWPLLMVTITQAQRALPTLSSELDTLAKALAAQVSELFMWHGLAAFPVVLVSQRLVSYGGAPDQALILDALRKATASGADGEAHAHLA